MMYMPDEEEKPECILKGCHQPRYNDKMFCEMHWKERRQKKVL